MDLSYLPLRITDALKNISIDKLLEIRLRIGQPIKVVYDNELFYLTYNGLIKNDNDLIYCNKIDIDYIVDKLTNYSYYAYSDLISKGVLISSEGHRIGISGECVLDDNKINCFKRILSLNVRIPHEIINCSVEIFNKTQLKHLSNLLIISPPLYGKTTIIKDLIRQFDKNYNINLLVLDERGELSNVNGENVDKLSFTSKEFAFKFGVRNLSPQMVFMDEIIDKSDMDSITNCVNSGIKVISTCHGEKIQDVKDKLWFRDRVFDYYVIINNFNKKIIYDKEFKCISD